MFRWLPVGKLISIPMNIVTKVPRVLKYRYDREYQLSIRGVLRENKCVPVRWHVMLLATKICVSNPHGKVKRHLLFLMSQPAVPISSYWIKN